MNKTKNIGIVLHSDGLLVSRWTEMSGSIPIGQTFSERSEYGRLCFKVEHVHSTRMGVRVMCLAPYDHPTLNGISKGALSEKVSLSVWHSAPNASPDSLIGEAIKDAFDAWHLVRDEAKVRREKMEILLRHAAGEVLLQGL